MGRLPFQPSGHGAGRRDQARPEATALRVSQAAARIAGMVRRELGEPMRVVGEISGFRERTHWYFDLKDAEAVLGCVMWRSSARRQAFVPEDGQEVVATATVDFYAKAGRLSLIVTRLEPVGAGALELAFRKLCDELRELGWFDADRKRPLPAFPRRVGVVTSRSAAALQDVLDTMRRRCPGVEVALIDVRVQGEGAAGEVARAVRWAGRHHQSLGLDALLLTRGGGSMEDLWAFNEREVAEAIVKSAVPVVAAIGHETDTTIAELVADVRAATPTQAAMALSPDRAALREQLDATAERLHGRLERMLTLEGRRLEALAQRPAMADARTPIHRARQRLASLGAYLASVGAGLGQRARGRIDALSARLERHRPVAAHARRASRLEVLTARLAAVLGRRVAREPVAWAASRLEGAARRRLERAAERTASLERELRAVGPIGVLERGYSVTTRDDGRLLRSVEDVAAGTRIVTRLADGRVGSVVEGKGPVAPRRSGSKRGRSPAEDESQMDLFGRPGEGRRDRGTGP